MTTLTEMMEKLAQPFDPDALQWKPQATTKDKKKALGVPYADPRAYIDRLNEVAGADWSDDYTILDGGAVVLCRLTVAGVTRSDVGESEANDQNTATSAVAQAFKRAAVKFGLGRYLYSLPKTWVAYDEKRRSFTPEGLAQLRRVAAGESPASATAKGSPRPARKAAQSASGNGTKPANGNGRSWPGATVQALLQEGLADHPKHAVNILNKSDLPADASPADALTWARAYRRERGNGSNVATAAARTNGKASDTALPVDHTRGRNKLFKT